MDCVYVSTDGNCSVPIEFVTRILRLFNSVCSGLVTAFSSSSASAKQVNNCFLDCVFLCLIVLAAQAWSAVRDAR